MNLAKSLALAAPGIDPADVVLLGEGVWGQVHDAGDGTVIKLLRQGGGLGEAEELWDNERATLRALEGLDLPFAVPRLVDAGWLDEAATGCRAFLRMTRLSGHALDDDSLAALAAAPAGRLAGQLGEALAALHACAMAEGFADSRAGVDLAMLEELAPRVADIAGPGAIAAIAESLTSLEGGATVANHGDINSTNILVDKRGDLVGLIDWAEARQDWREAEFCHLVMLPEVLAPVRAAYESAAGFSLDDRRLDLVGLHNALIGIVICRRIGETQEAAWNAGEARRLIARLGL
ncbi:MAG: aminoglycoside phosphotransferase family protein [Proteobacteria bacterium]|nr:aminoglycoside phosphotransferase family protein [Pseudomonadota bacterium]MDA0952747.1 aminoglycoside phosphotransferase family protein [Pseudomonadota bacterium]